MKLRNASDSDLELTYRIKSNSIKPYVKRIWGWDEEFQRAIHKQKFVASETQLIKYNGKEIGLIIVKESANEIFLQNILIEKNFQNMGIGRQLMERIIEKANFERKPIRLQVFKINLKAQKFYQKLGFKKIFEMENHFEMKKLSLTTDTNN